MKDTTRVPSQRRGIRRECALARSRIPRVAKKLAPYFAQHGFEWSTCAGVPTAREIAAALRRLVDSIERGAWFAQSGRLFARAECDAGWCLNIAMGMEIEP